MSSSASACSAPRMSRRCESNRADMGRHEHKPTRTREQYTHLHTANNHLHVLPACCHEASARLLEAGV
eukprot:7051841-Pyramimonas_sp.AAC.1